MGAAARRLADHVVVTSDNPRSEEPDAIIAAIVAGAEGAAPAGEGSAVEVEADRRAAIERAMEMARPGRHRADRGQGPRAGPGVRGRPQGPVRRPRGRARGTARAGRRLHGSRAAVIGFSPTEIARAAAGDLVAGAPSRPASTDAPVRAVVDSRQVGPGDLFVGLAGRARGRGRVRRSGDRGRRLGRDRDRRPHASGAVHRRRRRVARACSSPTDPLAALGALARAWLDRLRGAGLPGGRHHGLDRQDVDQGHPAGAC